MKLLVILAIVILSVAIIDFSDSTPGAVALLIAFITATILEITDHIIRNYR
jgi:hypothetical protein